MATAITREKRQCERSDVFLIVEFRPFKRNLRYSLGITRNFSPQGFSFESQNCDLKRGEVLDVVLKHPQKDVSLSVMGEIVWEQGAWYARLIGIKLWIMDEKARHALTELIGASRDMSWESFNRKRDPGTLMIEKEGGQPAADVNTSGIVKARLEDLKNTGRKSAKQGLLSGTGDRHQRDAIAGKLHSKGLKTGKMPELPDWSPLRPQHRKRKGNSYLSRMAVFALVTVAALIIPFKTDKGVVPSLNNEHPDRTEMPYEALHAEYSPEISGTLPQEEKTVLFDVPETPVVIEHAEGVLPEEGSDKSGAGDVTIKKERANAAPLTKNITFDENSDFVKPGEYSEIDKIANVLLMNSYARINVIFFVGQDSSSIDLSVRRATAVKNFLVYKGIAPSRIEMIGLGDTYPAESGSSESSRNRKSRIEIQVVPS